MDDIKYSEQDGIMIIELIGDFVEKDTAGLRDIVEEALRGSTSGFVVTMSKVDFVDSSGVKSLLEIKKLVEGNKRKIILCEIPSHIFPIFERMQLETVFSITKTLNKAIEKAKAK
ncbi:MAG: STAS domain-containing protein [bacterium]